MRVVFPAPLPPQIPHVLVTDGQGTNVAVRLHPKDDRFGTRTCQAPVMESQRTPSSRGEIAPFFVMEVMRAAEERELAGGQVLHLEVGQPSTPAPAGVIEAAHRALDEDVLGYTTAAGTPELRARVARHYDEWYGVEVVPDGAEPGDSSDPIVVNPGVDGQTAEDVAKRIGLRSDGVFGKDYVRVARHALEKIFLQHPSVEAFVKAECYQALECSNQAGLKVKYRELISYAKTVDAQMRGFKGTNPDDLYNDYVLELNIGNIARYLYSSDTGNYAGASFISGADSTLLPTEAIKQAQNFTTQQGKMATALQGLRGGGGGGPGGGGGGGGGAKGKGKGGKTGQPFVPVADRKCYICGKTGHLAANCPEKATMAAAGKKE